MIYLDNNASTRVFERVVDAMDQFLPTRFANPGSAYGRELGLDRIITEAKTTIGTALGDANPARWLFTSGATESNNLALIGARRAAAPDRRQIVISAVEHPSVAETAAALGRDGCEIRVIPVDRNGIVDPADVVAELSPRTLLVSVMLANNETGVLQPLAQIAAAVKELSPDVLVHTDATQAIGKVPVDLAAALSAVDLLSFSAHKFHGPKGAGALYVRDPGRLAPILHGGGQQGGLRPGTESPALAVGVATALETVRERAVHYGIVAGLRDQLEAKVRDLVPGAFALGAAAPRLPTTSYLCLPGCDGAEIVARLADRDIAIAAGSTCGHGQHQPSSVALAMDFSPAEALSCIRVSLSLETTPGEISEFVTALGEALSRGAGRPAESTNVDR